MSTIGQEAADRAEQALTAFGAGNIASEFTEWARSKGLLDRITEQECADLAAAFGAGFARGVGVGAGFTVAHERRER